MVAVSLKKKILLTPFVTLFSHSLFFFLSILVFFLLISFPFLFLLFCILTGYYFSGIFLEPGLALSNINSRLEYIIRHPVSWYCNEKSSAGIIWTVLAWLYILSQYLYQQRDFQFGREYGTSQWADPEEISRQLMDSLPENNRILSKHLHI